MNPQQYSNQQPNPSFLTKKYIFTPEVTEGNFNVGLVPYTSQKHDFAKIQTVNLFNSLQFSESKFQEYQILFHNILHKYDGFHQELELLKQLLNKILMNKLFKLTPIKLLINREQDLVQRLAQKLKVLYSKGRKHSFPTSIPQHIQNSIQRCERYAQVFQTNHFQSQSFLRTRKYEKLKEYKMRFNIISPRRAYNHTTHPFQQDLPDQTVCVVPFYVQKLLVRPGRQLVPFPSYLLYCPIIFDQEKKDYKIANEYISELNQYQKDWQNKVLMIQILVNQKPFYYSYLQTKYKLPLSTLDSICLIRDRVFQFMIMEFLKHIVNTKRNQVIIQCSIPELKIKFSIENIPKEKSKQSIRSLEFISLLLTFLKGNKIKNTKSKELVHKIKDMFEETIVSKTLSYSNTQMVTETKSRFTRYFKKNPNNVLITSEISIEELLRQGLGLASKEKQNKN